MTPQEIVTELRKIASYSTSKKDVCTQAADLIEEFQEEYDIISAANIELHSAWEIQNKEILKLQSELEKNDCKQGQLEIRSRVPSGYCG